MVNGPDRLIFRQSPDDHSRMVHAGYDRVISHAGADELSLRQRNSKLLDGCAHRTFYIKGDVGKTGGGKVAALNNEQ